MELHKLHAVANSRNHKRKIKGRGYGSGMGKRSTRGQKGQKARKSGNVRIGFEGGQTPLYRRLPKIGFSNIPFKNNYQVVNLSDIAKLDVRDIDLDVLKKNKLISNKKNIPVRIIGKVASISSINLTAHYFTAGAKKSIENAGGNINIIKFENNEQK